MFTTSAPCQGNNARTHHFQCANESQLPSRCRTLCSRHAAIVLKCERHQYGILAAVRGGVVIGSHARLTKTQRLIERPRCHIGRAHLQLDSTDIPKRGQRGPEQLAAKTPAPLGGHHSEINHFRPLCHALIPDRSDRLLILYQAPGLTVRLIQQALQKTV